MAYLKCDLECDLKCLLWAGQNWKQAYPRR